MKYLIILISIVLFNYLFSREGLYNKNITSNNYIPNCDKINDVGLTANALHNNTKLVNENIYNNQKSSIYLNNITLLS
jgi:hypothetical protein